MGQIVVLGANGMLGSQVSKELISSGFKVTTAVRQSNFKAGDKILDYRSNCDSLGQFFKNEPNVDVVVNCIGLIKQKFSETFQKKEMIELNTLLPMELDQCAEKYNFQVIQIATDCVFSGERGQYVESSPHDANDLYGVTKSLGEIDSKRYMNLRCSIIGNEINSRHSLHDWFLGNSANSTVTGYTNHFWNGVTTVSFARIVSGIIKTKGFLPGTRHIVPSDMVSKYDLLKLIGDINDRGDITVEPFENEIGVDRTLNTVFPHFNETLWSWAGYEGIPSIRDMIAEMDLTSRMGL